MISAEPDTISQVHQSCSPADVHFAQGQVQVCAAGDAFRRHYARMRCQCHSGTISIFSSCQRCRVEVVKVRVPPSARSSRVMVAVDGKARITLAVSVRWKLKKHVDGL